MLSMTVALGVALTLIFLRIPIGIALALVGFGGLVHEVGWNPARAAVSMATQSSTMTYSLSVLPLFILMGNLVAGAGISGQLFSMAQKFLGHRRGGLAMASIVACGGFGAICGSSVATAATMTRVALPSMRRFGYADRLSAGSLAAGGTLGILIPPSVIMVIYAVSTQTHVGKLFAAGIVPGLLGVLGYVLTIRMLVWRDPSIAPSAARAPWSARIASLTALWPVLVLFGLVMGGLYSGLFTSTEAAGIGAIGAFVFALTRRSLTRADIHAIFVDTALVSGSMILLLIGAAIFVEFVNLTGVHAVLEGLVRDSGVSPLGAVFVIVAIYIVLGCFLESISMILITVPIFFPIVTGLGFDPVWFGLVVVVATEIGLITPPIGINLFVIRSIQSDIPFATIVRGVMPFVLMDVLRVAIIVVFPVLTLWLPNLLFD